jgi:hypothetical protein
MAQVGLCGCEGKTSVHGLSEGHTMPVIHSVLEGECAIRGPVNRGQCPDYSSDELDLPSLFSLIVWRIRFRMIRLRLA